MNVLFNRAHSIFSKRADAIIKELNQVRLQQKSHIFDSLDKFLKTVDKLNKLPSISAAQSDLLEKIADKLKTIDTVGTGTRFQNGQTERIKDSQSNILQSSQTRIKSEVLEMLPDSVNPEATSQEGEQLSEEQKQEFINSSLAKVYSKSEINKFSETEKENIMNALVKLKTQISKDEQFYSLS